MGQTPKLGEALQAKIEEARQKLVSAKKARWNLSPAALREFGYTQSFIPRDHFSLSAPKDEHIAAMVTHVVIGGFDEHTCDYVYRSYTLADGLAELVDIETGDTVTITVWGE